MSISFLKDNTLLPLADPVEHVDPTTCFKVTVNVYGSSPTPCALYEDDGVSYDFEKGTQNRVQFGWKGGAGAAQKSGSYAGPARYQISGWTVK
jgi:alpha-D-xyloside xylohydrolase